MEDLNIQGELVADIRHISILYFICLHLQLLRCHLGYRRSECVPPSTGVPVASCRPIVTFLHVVGVLSELKPCNDIYAHNMIYKMIFIVG